MLHILFVILKILGIVLVSLLALLLLILLIVLLVPIRYQLDAKKRDEIIVKMRVNWLLRLVFIRIWYINEQLHIKLRIFGIPIWDNLKPKKEKKVKKSKNKQSESEWPEEEEQDIDGKEIQSVDDVLGVKKEDQSLETRIQSDKKTQNIEDGIDSLRDKSPSETKIKQLEEKEVQLVIKTKENEISDSEVNRNSDKHETDLQEFEQSESKEQQDEGKSLDEQLQDDTLKHKQSKIRKLIEKITSLFTKIKNIIQKIPKLFTNLKEKVLQVKKIFVNLSDKKNKIIAFFKEEKNKAGIKAAFVQVIALLRHCGPQKLRGYIKFGMEDPATTGQLLGVASIVYAKFQGTITFEPDFEHSVFEAEVMARGRIRIISLLIIGIRLILDKNFKELLKNVKQIKEELV